MAFLGFSTEDFLVFEIPGLEQRMQALRSNIQPKFREIGQAMVGDVAALIGMECYVHIAKHARRKVNPPNDSWLSFATSSRGYKMLPHFQIGLWSTHAFVQFAIIYECTRKAEFAERLLQNWETIKKQIPENFVWYDDHIQPKPYKHAEVDTQIERLAERLIKSKKAEMLCGIEIPKEQAIRMSGQEFLDVAYDAIKNLLPLYALLP